MASVTVPGTSGSTITLPQSASANLTLANQIATQLAAALSGGTLFVASVSGGGSGPSVPGGKTGELVIAGSSSTPTGVPAGYQYVVDDSTAAGLVIAANDAIILTGTVRSE